MADKISPEAEAAYQRIHASDDFQGLKKAYLGFVVPATIAFMAWYLLYVLCSNYAPDLMAIRVVGNINIALVWGLLQFVTTFGLAYWYSQYSARRMDPTADRLGEEFEQEINR
ncbi:DUF485 domain-containing protein [Aeromicrobium sp. CF3.5]|uniref:DUF485 domain-containing protein n=1 Tax=Aeromicrobium sp. CF3.5 TaxID=3373078 RepID=UPI003EE42826